MKIANIDREKLLNALRNLSEIFRKDVTEGIKLIPPSYYPLVNVTNGSYKRLTFNIFSLTCDIVGRILRMPSNIY